MVEHLNGLIDSLALDHKRGAAEIVKDIAELFAGISELSVDYPEVAEQLFFRAVKCLAKGQPTMAPVLNLLNQACQIYESVSGDWDRFRSGIDGLIQKRAVSLSAILSHINELDSSLETLIIFSNSSTVAKVVIKCYEKGFPKRIYIGEGRPVMEGLIMAHKLTSAGLDVTILTDAALMSKVEEADAVWVGGDALRRDGLVNKMGSRALSALAKHYGKSFISFISSDKILSPAMEKYFKYLPQNPREIGAERSETLKIENFYYEVIPLENITNIFCERGLKNPIDIVKDISDENLSPLFINLVPS